MLYVTADHHFYHRKIMEYCDRPFSSLEEMHEEMIYNWNSVVKEDDIVLHLGDFCLSSSDDLREISRKLKGDKRIIMGNHDKQRNKVWEELGWEVVLDRRGYVVEGLKVFSHYPIDMCIIPGVNFHGHTHNNFNNRLLTQKNVCVSVENMYYTPVRIPL